ncbi:DUF222 domain-containing protein [Pimelobacter simplex]|uniref:Putative HNH endonuclease domain protein n=1 Tax=Nocardioides simplex TaxID=2045 RepID=A0A0C5XN49_NOCSI|nr:HNH endonuclease signature motif containing protein [Pimelobacter simplex]AJR18857.1 putative HNH endonuclease domain protein [Pimelobacter simplex]MCG8150799.1 DUF222 domain-containing protein [Pimelobacter simplex]GEB15318.1 hypothetical protein NSI01_36330 [Pimelobacter simplex]SFM83667.1 HNH endonuclease [Pimelobacter simplex]
MTTSTALDQATVVAEAASALAGLDHDQLAPDEAVLVAAEIARAKALLDAALLEVTARLEETAAVQDQGWATTKDFLTHTLGGHKGSGGGLVRATKQLRELPDVRAALRAGEVSLAQARTVATEVGTLPHDPELRATVAGRLLDLVRTQGHDASDLRAAFPDVVREVDPERSAITLDLARSKNERGAHHARFLSFAPDHLGGMRIRGYCTTEDAERVLTVLLPLSAPVTTEPEACGGRRIRPDDPLVDAAGLPSRRTCPTPGCNHDGRDPRDHGVRLWDALVDACHRLSAADLLPHDHGARPRVVVTIDHAFLRHEVVAAGHAPAGDLASGRHLSAAAVRRLACDAEIIPAVLGSASRVLDLGRSQRLVTPALWQALVLRDRHCSFPGCRRLPLACDAHHVVHWADGGRTSLDNMALLCRHHHLLTHESPWTVTIDTATGRPTWTGPPRVGPQGRVTVVPARAGPGRSPLVA